MVAHVSSLVGDLQRLVQHQLWFEDLGSVLLMYKPQGEHVGYIATE